MCCTYGTHSGFQRFNKRNYWCQDLKTVIHHTLKYWHLGHMGLNIFLISVNFFNMITRKIKIMLLTSYSYCTAKLILQQDNCVYHYGRDYLLFYDSFYQLMTILSCCLISMHHLISWAKKKSMWYIQSRNIYHALCKNNRESWFQPFSQLGRRYLSKHWNSLLESWIRRWH